MDLMSKVFIIHIFIIKYISMIGVWYPWVQKHAKHALGVISKEIGIFYCSQLLIVRINKS